MFVFPIGQERGHVRRLPIVTLLLVLANMLVFLLARDVTRSRFDDALNTALQYYAEHPYLSLPPELSSELGESAVEQIELRVSATRRAVQTPAPATLRANQAELDGLCHQVVTLLARDNARNYGYVPGRPRLLTLFTSQFLHDGWLHLISNMILLCLTGPFVEDVFGRAAFAVLYLTGGAIAALSHAAIFSESLIPLIGASGAISAAMGAFLIRFHRTRIRFVYFFWYLRVYYGRFSAPAFLVLPLWLVSEVAKALLSGSSSGVANLAHIGGFAYGGALALAIRWSRFEERVVWPTMSGVVGSSGPHPAVVLARDARDDGRADDAIDILEAALSTAPRDVDVHLELCWSLFDTGQPDQAAEVGARGIALAVRAGRVAEADRALTATRAEMPAFTCPRTSLAAIARHALVSGEPERALDLYVEAGASRRPDLTAAKALAAGADVALTLDRPAEAHEMLRRALTIDGLDRALKIELRQRLEEVASEAGLGSSSVASTPPAPVAPPVQRPTAPPVQQYPLKRGSTTKL